MLPETRPGVGRRGLSERKAGPAGPSGPHALGAGLSSVGSRSVPGLNTWPNLKASL